MVDQVFLMRWIDFKRVLKTKITFPNTRSEFTKGLAGSNRHGETGPYFFDKHAENLKTVKLGKCLIYGR